MYRYFKFLYIRIYLSLFYKPMCFFCVRLRILRTFVYGFCTSCVAFAYKYVFLCSLSGFCVHIRIFVGCERIFAYVYGFLCAMSGFLRTDTDF